MASRKFPDLEVPSAVAEAMKKGGVELEGKVADHVARYDHSVVEFATKAERLMLCSAGGNLGSASKESGEAFSSGDLDHSGSLVADELTFALKQAGVEGITLEQAQAMIKGYTCRNISHVYVCAHAHTHTHTHTYTHTHTHLHAHAGGGDFPYIDRYTQIQPMHASI